MKTCFLLLCLLSAALTGFSQATVSVEYTLRYNLFQSRYEVYARPNASQTNFSWGSSQITVVTPSSFTDVAISSVTTVAGGPWGDLSQAYNVQGSDFHGFASNGTPVTLQAGVETLLFTFTLPGGACLPGLRLYVNGSDPTSSAPGMNGGDFANTLYSANDALSASNLYVGNYANTGTFCTACNLSAPTLTK